MTARCPQPGAAPPRFNKGSQSRAGFMLVEMLVAMAVGAFLLVALASVTTFVLKAQDRFSARAQEAEVSGRALASLAREIGPALRLRWTGEKAGFVFSGTSGRLLFARDVPAAGGFSRTEAVLWEVRSLNGATTLLRAAGPLPPDAASPDAVAWGPPATVYAGGARIAFAYFMPLEGGGEALLDDWPAGNEMPAAVRIALAKPNQAPISLRVPLLIETDPRCALDDTATCGKGESGSEGEEPDAVAPGDDQDENRLER